MRRSVIVGLALALGACEGVISEPGQQPGQGPGGGGTGTGVGKDALVPSPRLARLTHEQWENTLGDLFGFNAQVGLSSGFPTDPSVAGFLFGNDASSLSVDSALWGAYQRAATDLAAQVVADSAVMDRILPPDTLSPDERARAFIDNFGKRVYRRPLTQAEKDELFVVYQGAPPLFNGVEPFTAGVQLLISAFLQSPLFLYRIESSTAKKGGAIPLTGWETASRLSYMLWNSMPDDKLLASAESGALGTVEGVEKEARRLLESDRATDAIVHFHQTMLEVEKFAIIKPQSALFPDAPADLPDLAKQENDLFLRFLLESGAGYRDLLTSNVSFINDDLAKIYGLSGSFDSSFKQTTLPNDERRGVFTQVGFLAANAGGADPDPIHRGAFLARRINCYPVSAPPGDIPPLPASNGRTNRETVEDHTEQPGSDCANCHSSYINPFGFPFESYDAIGAYRTEDKGTPVNTQAEPLIDEIKTPVSNALELADRLAESPNIHECYAKYWVEFSFGRKSVPADEGIVRHLGTLSKDGQSIQELIVSLVKTRAFRNRSTQEMP